MDLLRNVNGKMLHCGYTTGSCAAAATKAALIILLTKQRVNSVIIDTPAGIKVTTEILDVSINDDYVKCAVRKDSGDDPDATRDMLVYSKVSFFNDNLKGNEISIKGGEGVGIVTKPGLDQPVGEYAINSTPRTMITDVVRELTQKFDYSGGISIELSIPGGEEVAKGTFNPRMGIEGGLSIIGTSGIVEPMSYSALVGTIATLIKQLALRDYKRILLTPGNYGNDFARNELLLDMEYDVNCSNFIGEAIDIAVELGFKKILLVGHIGKLVKLGIGVTNTHSSMGDGRIECLLRCAIKAGAPIDALRKIDECMTTDAALDVMRNYGLCESAMRILGKNIEDTLGRRVPPGIEVEYICFTKDVLHKGILCHSDNAFEIIPRRN